MTSIAPDQPHESETVPPPARKPLPHEPVPHEPVPHEPVPHEPVPHEPVPHIARPYRALERELERAVRDRVEVNLRVTAAVNAMRDGGCSWADIARILGTAPQTAHKKYSKPRPPREPA